MSTPSFSRMANRGIDGTHAWHGRLLQSTSRPDRRSTPRSSAEWSNPPSPLALCGGHQRDDGTQRDDDAGLASGGCDDAEVLAVQLDAEAGLERPGQHVLALLVKDLAAGEAAAEDRERGLGVDAVRLQERDRLGEKLDVAGDDELVGGLDGLPDPFGLTWTIVLPTASRTGRAASKSPSSPPTMIESGGLGPRLAAGDGRVEDAQSFSFACAAS